MSDAMSKAELLLPGLEPRDLEPGEVKKMFGPAATPRQRLEGQGIEFVKSEAEMGGGGGAIDAIDDWVVSKRGGYEKLLQQIEQNKWGDNLVWKLPDGTQISVAEVRRRAAVAASPPAPEPQPAPRPGDWRDRLPLEQRQRLGDFENRIANATPQQLKILKTEIEEAQLEAMRRKWPDGLWISEADAPVFVKTLDEEIKRKAQLVSIELIEERINKMGLREHIESIKSRLHLSSDAGVVLVLQATERKAKMLLRNPPYELFPPDLRDVLIALIRNRGNGGS